jgi:hypothetical protein
MGILDEGSPRGGRTAQPHEGSFVHLDCLVLKKNAKVVITGSDSIQELRTWECVTRDHGASDYYYTRRQSPYRARLGAAAQGLFRGAHRSAQTTVSSAALGRQGSKRIADILTLLARQDWLSRGVTICQMFGAVDTLNLRPTIIADQSGNGS